MKKTKQCILLFLLWLFASGVLAQTGVVKGIVMDREGVPLPGVSVMVVGAKTGTTTSLEGKYALTNVSSGSELEFRYLGYETKTEKVGDRTEINVVMQESYNELEELTVVAFQKQKKESVVAAITTVSPKELKVPQANLTSALAGRMSGLIAYQRSGEPGQDNADFFIRGVTSLDYGKVDPLILIDGLEVTKEDLARLEPDNIESFSLLKDATATALYGARGGNGAILVTTKTGKKGKMSISARLETQVSTPTKVNDFLDGVTYMEMYNEALRMREPTAELRYGKDKIEATRRGDNPDIYPNVDWYNELFSDYAQNYKANISATGGGDVAQYYLSVAYTNEKGVLKVDPLNNFNNNISIQRFNIRGNINFNFTKTTKGSLKMYQLYDIYNGPITEASDVFAMVMQANPVNFPKTYNPNAEYAANYKYVKHTLFGNKDAQATMVNPYAQLVRGYKDRFSSTNQAQFSVEQDLKMLTEGLKFRALVATNIFARHNIHRSISPFYYYTVPVESQLGITYNLLQSNVSSSEILEIVNDDTYTYSSLYGEGAFQYDRVFADKHTIGALLVGTVRQGLNEYKKDKTPTESTDLVITTLPSRNIGLAGRLSYAFDNRYFLEGNFGYTGSEKFAKKNQFQFFPSIGLAWNVSNEHFYPASWKKIVNTFKLKYTRGLAGVDDISDPWDRFYYLSDVSQSGYGYTWGSETRVGYTGYTVNRYANEDITWMVSLQTNYGVEIGLFDKLNLQVDYYTDHKTNIYMEREFTPATMGLTADIYANIGVVDKEGVDVSLDYQWAPNKDFWMTARANFTYVSSILKANGEPDYAYPYLSHIGQPSTQLYGLVAERLFIDEDDIHNSPPQFNDSEILPGDIKYVDINHDGVVDGNDVVPIGYPTAPELIYGFGASAGYKNFDVSFFFQGSGRSSFFIEPTKIAPFVNERNALTVIADNHWSYDNPDPHAFWPRMAVDFVKNNENPAYTASDPNKTLYSTWWLRDGTFLRLKTVELGYTVPDAKMRKLGISGLRFYFSGTNLLNFSSFKLWDTEMAGNGLGYPTQRVFNLGLQFTF